MLPYFIAMILLIHIMISFTNTGVPIHIIRCVQFYYNIESRTHTHTHTECFSPPFGVSIFSEQLSSSLLCHIYSQESLFSFSAVTNIHIQFVSFGMKTRRRKKKHYKIFNATSDLLAIFLSFWVRFGTVAFDL